MTGETTGDRDAILKSETKMKEWSRQTISVVNEKTQNIKNRDLRFYRVDELKRNILRVGTFSDNCPVCEKERWIIEEIVDKMDEAIQKPGQSRRNYDRLISRLASHMQKKHGFFTPYYYTYLYSFLGMIAGLLTGYFLMKLFPAFNEIMLSVGFIAGLLAGYFTGNWKDGKIRSKKKLM